MTERENLVKYPRTMHLPWSLGLTNDDKKIACLDAFIGQRVIVTEKMDGENTSMYSDYIHARSLNGGNHLSRDWVKQFYGTCVKDGIPIGWRVCGENLYAKHSIHYKELPSYFLGFSLWNIDNICLDWDKTIEWFTALGITSVPILYDGVYDEKTIKALWNEKDGKEGYVIRLAKSFHYDDFNLSVAKFVRENHIQTDEHWSQKPIEKNLLK